MQKLFYIIIAISILIIIALFVLGFMSKKGQAPGLKNGQLQACISTDNCVISEGIDDIKSSITPFSFTGNKEDFYNTLVEVIKSKGGIIVNSNSNYIATTFTSGLFGFVDDVEFRLTDDNLLHFRSASRVGRKDFGANKKRIDELKLVLEGKN